jgi:serine/threonine-protein kinase HipA
MQKGIVYKNELPVGEIGRDDRGLYGFFYYEEYLQSENPSAISVNLPLKKEPFVSKILFPFFFNLLSEGNLKTMQCRELKIDEDDNFTRLLKTTQENTIGAITLKEI